MKKLAIVLALAPALALGAPQASPTQAPAPRGPAAPAAGPNAADATLMQQRMQKRMRLARTLGLADALDLDEAAAVRARDVIAKYDEKRVPLGKAMRDDMRVLRDAASGDKAAAGQVDGAIQRLRETRTQLQKIDADMFAQLTQGMPAEKKARAALFLSRFRSRTAGMMGGHGMGMGHGMGPCGLGGGMGACGMGGRGMGMEHGRGPHGGPGWGEMGLAPAPRGPAGTPDRLAMSQVGQPDADTLGASADVDEADLAVDE